MRAVALGVDEAPGLLVEGRRCPAGGLEQTHQRLLRQSLSRHRPRRPAVVDEPLHRVIGLAIPVDVDGLLLHGILLPIEFDGAKPLHCAPQETRVEHTIARPYSTTDTQPRAISRRRDACAPRKHRQREMVPTPNPTHPTSPATSVRRSTPATPSPRGGGSGRSSTAQSSGWETPPRRPIRR